MHEYLRLEWRRDGALGKAQINHQILCRDEFGEPCHCWTSSIEIEERQKQSQFLESVCSVVLFFFCALSVTTINVTHLLIPWALSLVLRLAAAAAAAAAAVAAAASACAAS